MIPWRVVRIICSLLLLLPLVHVAYLISTATLSTLDASPETWNSEIEAYAAADARVQLPEKPILVTGGLPAKLWFGLEDVLAPQPIKLTYDLTEIVLQRIVCIYDRIGDD